MEKLISLKDLRLNMEKYASQVKQGQSFIILKRSKPIFQINPVSQDGDWEELINFAQIKKGGVEIKDLLKLL